MESKQELFPGWKNEEEIKKYTGFKTTKLWKLRQLNQVTWSRIGGKIYYKVDSFIALLENNIQN